MMKCILTVVSILIVMKVISLKGRAKRNLNTIKHKTAVITGASSGIGMAFAKYLAKRGFELTLVARSKKVLEELQEKLKEYKVSVSIFEADLSTNAGTNSLIEYVNKMEKPLGAFFNCAGITHKIPEALVDLPREENENIINLHVMQATHLAQAINVVFKKQKSGLFVQMASGLGIVTMPLLSVYAASKTYLITLMRAINEESRAFNARFIAACPFWVSTPMTMTKKTTSTFIQPETFVSDFFADSWKKTIVNPHSTHKLVEKMLMAMPEGKRMKKLHKDMIGTRSAIIKKLSRKQ
ncbi:Oxidoreductase [Hexamita inflata]|uniref:Oxidoreductase n=1 Tax=Hexamita inflata TaxID=28002 RepID=A0AA86NQQ5_9EUKA|nr:Oxidoreductase [Hexamita inflata]CAI9923927.1 Oxidoreductase [Hexamita inflata]